MRYTLEPGRWVYRDGDPFISIGCAHTSKATGSAAINPAEADKVAHEIVRWLNHRDYVGHLEWKGAPR